MDVIAENPYVTPVGAKLYWKQVYAEVSVNRYPVFMPKMLSRKEEQTVVRDLYDICCQILTRDERKAAVEFRLRFRASRGEIKLYPKDQGKVW